MSVPGLIKFTNDKASGNAALQKAYNKEFIDETIERLEDRDCDWRFTPLEGFATGGSGGSWGSGCNCNPSGQGWDAGSLGYFGARWYRRQLSTALKRTGDAKGYQFSPAIKGYGLTTGFSSFDTKPIYRDMKLVNVLNGVKVAEEDDISFRRDGSNGDVMLEIPRFYFKIVQDIDFMEFMISSEQIDETWNVSPRHAPTVSNPNGWERIYVGAYTCDTNYKSISGVASKVSITFPTARSGIVGRAGGYSMYDYATYSTLCLLYLVEVANLNSQASLGYGNASSSAQINTGVTDVLGFHSGTVGNTIIENACVKYRGIENIFGNIWQMVDGINFNNNDIYVCREVSNYGCDKSTGYDRLSYTKAPSGSASYIKNFGFDPDHPYATFIPTELNGAADSYIPDHYWSSTGWRVLFVGGAWASGAGGGLFAFDSTDASSYSYAHIGCRPLWLP